MSCGQLEILKVCYLSLERVCKISVPLPRIFQGLMGAIELPERRLSLFEVGKGAR